MHSSVRIQSILPAFLTFACLVGYPLRAQTDSPAIIVAKTITLNSNAIVDSFNSVDPLTSNNYPYDPANRHSNGNILVVNNIASDLHNAFVYGGLTYSGPAVKNCANVQGAIATPSTAAIAAVSDPAWSDGGFVQYTGGGNPPASAFVADGTPSNPTLIKVVGDFTVPGGKTFSIYSSVAADRYVTVWVTGKFTTSGSGRIVQDQYAHITWIVDKDITVSGDNYQNNSIKAGNVSLTAVGPGKVNISGGNSLLALVNAPSRDLNISGTGLTGSVIASTLNLSGSSAVHFDEAFASTGTFRISFEGQPPNTAYGVSQYVEREIQFTGQPDLIHNGGGGNGWPNDGTGYLQGAYRMAFLDLYGRLLKLKAVDLAEYSAVYAYPYSITFVGSKANGATVSQTFALDGQLGVPGVPDFQTFTFGDEWVDLVRIDVQGDYGFSMDNIALER
jgi:hypothetical protein